MQLILQFHLSY